MLSRRPLFSTYSNPASRTSRTFHRVLTGTRVSRNSSSGACSEMASRRFEALVGEPVDRRDEPDGRHGDAALRQPEPVGGGVGERPYGSHDPLVVGERLAHAHEHDVGKPRGPTGDLTVPQRPHPVHDLMDDLGGGQIPVQPRLPGRTERAVHPAPGLRTDAHGHPVGIPHQHRLDERPVEQPPQRLAGRPLVRRQMPYDGHQLGKQHLLQLPARSRPECRSTPPGRARTARSSAARAAWHETASRRSRPPLPCARQA